MRTRRALRQAVCVAIALLAVGACDSGMATQVPSPAHTPPPGPTTTKLATATQPTLTPPRTTSLSLAASPTCEVYSKLLPRDAKIVFQSDMDGDGRSNISVLDADGDRGVTTTDGTFTDFMPVWSRAGCQIGFVSSRDGMDNIYVMNSDGTGQRKVTNFRWGAYEPSWSPDGGRLVFVGRVLAHRDQQFDIFLINVDGSALVTLTNTFGDEMGPSWSPDGLRIAFASWEGICVINADGSDRRVVIPNEHWFYRDPTWSPDGQRIAFTGQNGQIYSVNPDGGSFSRLTDLHVSAVLDPSWAPDGRRIAFSDNEFIYILDLESGSACRLLRGSNPDWRK